MAEATWDDAVVLAGFLTRRQLEPFVQEAQKKLTQAQVDAIWKAHGDSRQFVQTLPVEDLADVGVVDLDKRFAFRGHEIRKTSDFQEVYGERDCRFVMIKPEKLAVFQFQVRVGGKSFSADPSSILDECLPRTFILDADLELIRDPTGQAYQVTVTTDTGNAHLGGVKLNHASQSAEIQFIPNRNWVQVAHFEKRYWLHNGYHRVHNLMALGVSRIPCIVFEAEDPAEVAGGVLDPRSFERLRRSKRPPLMKDFLGKAAIRIIRRRHKTMLVVNIQAGIERTPV